MSARRLELLYWLTVATVGTVSLVALAALGVGCSDPGLADASDFSAMWSEALDTCTRDCRPGTPSSVSVTLDDRSPYWRSPVCRCRPETDR